MSTSGRPHRTPPAVVVAGAVGWIVLGVLTVVVVVVDGPLPGEIAIIRWLQELGQPAPALADVVGIVTGTEGNLLLGVVPSVWLIRRHGRAGAMAVAICLAAMLVVQPVSKELIDRDRPSAADVEVRADASSRSYPSGHSLSTTTVWGTAAIYAGRRGRRRAAALLAAPIVCTAVSSGIDGVHWPSDVVAGTIVGATAAWLAASRVPPAIR